MLRLVEGRIDWTELQALFGGRMVEVVETDGAGKIVAIRTPSLIVQGDKVHSPRQIVLHLRT